MSGTVLVTGGSGFLGLAVVARLRARGTEVRTLARAGSPALAALGVDQRLGDVGDAEAVLAATAGVEAVIHTAAKAGVAGDAGAYYLANVVGTRHVVAACRRHAVRRLVHTSSPSVVFAGSDQEGVDERAPYPARFLAPYPRTKAEAERSVLAANTPELATVALRPHLIWGPGDPHLAPRLMAQARAERLRLVGGGAKLVDAVYVDNAADAHLLALDRLRVGAPLAGKAYFITNHEPWPLAALVNAILAAGGLAPVTRTIPAWTAYLAGWAYERSYARWRPEREPPLTRFVAKQLATAHWYDTTAATRELGYRPQVSMDEGLRRLTHHFATLPPRGR